MLTLWALIIAMTASAQTVEDGHSLDGPDEDQALAILDSYRDIAPPQVVALLDVKSEPVTVKLPLPL